MTASRIFNERGRGPSEPSSGPPVKVTKSDTVDIPIRGRNLLVGTPGTITLVYDNPDGVGAEVLVVNPPLVAGYNPLGNIKRIQNTGTAGDLWIVT